MTYEKQLAFHSIAGVCHDLWNAIKNSAKKRTREGKARPTLWSSVVRYSSVQNVNHGPFRSGVWGKGKQTAARRVSQTQTSKGVSFRELARLQSLLMGWQEPVTDEEFEWYFNQMITAESATSAGPILKFARWESVQ